MAPENITLLSAYGMWVWWVLNFAMAYKMTIDELYL